MPDGATKTDLNTMLQRAGIAPATAEAVLAIDALLQHWRRRAMKRELGQRALEDLGIDLDLAQLDVLVAIDGPEAEFGGSAGETMVATVAERLNIDPSRASRLVSEMVELGYTRRAVSQADARRAIVELTNKGHAVVDAVRAYKLLIMGGFLSSWAPEDVANFIPLMRKFGAWSEHSAMAATAHGEEIAVLSRRIRETV